jgi:similar to stage IV sporulation protein
VERFISVMMGYYEVEFHGKMLHRFINICKTHRIYLWKLYYKAGMQCEKNKAHPHFCVLQSDFDEACNCAKKCEAHLTICSRHGFPEFLKQHRKNAFFAAGLCVAAVLIYILSCYIWNVEIDGNYYYSQSTLVAFLESEGAGCGSKKSQIVPSEIEENIRIHYPKIAWVSARIVGTRLLISVEEAAFDIKTTAETTLPSDITADMDGTVLSIVTRQGTPMVHAGDTVEQGEVLIRGSVDIVGDDQSVLETRVTGADGDVWMRYQVPVQIDIKRSQLKKVYTQNTYALWHIHFGSHDIKLPGKQQDFKYADRVDSWRKFRLTQYFYLPIQLEKNLFKEYEMVREQCTDEILKVEAAQKMSKIVQNIVNAEGLVTDTQTDVQITTDGYTETGFLEVEIPAGRLP